MFIRFIFRNEGRPKNEDEKMGPFCSREMRRMRIEVSIPQIMILEPQSKNPKVLIDFLSIILFWVAQNKNVPFWGPQDAVRVPGTSLMPALCIHLLETCIIFHWHW